MSTKESAIIAQFTVLKHQGLITQHELDWCVGAVRNRHGLTRKTRRQLRDTIQVILGQARTRSLKQASK
jgi:peptidyl-tRNA hydrolase